MTKTTGQRIHETLLRLFLRKWRNLGEYAIVLKLEEKWYLTRSGEFEVLVEHLQVKPLDLISFIPVLTANQEKLRKHRMKCLDRFMEGSLIHSLEKFVLWFGITTSHTGPISTSYTRVRFLSGQFTVGMLLAIHPQRSLTKHR